MESGTILRPPFSVGVFCLSDIFALSIVPPEICERVCSESCARFCKSNGEPNMLGRTNPTGRSHVPVFGVKVRANLIGTIFSTGSLKPSPALFFKS